MQKTQKDLISAHEVIDIFAHNEPECLSNEQGLSSSGSALVKVNLMTPDGEMCRPMTMRKKNALSITGAIKKLGANQKESTENLAAALTEISKIHDKRSITKINSRMVVLKGTLTPRLSQKIDGMYSLENKLNKLINAFVPSTRNK